MNISTLRRLAWVAGGAALILALLTITRSPLVWRDEIVLAAIASSLAQGGSGAPTVFAEDPRFPMTTFFYGPSFFWAGAAAFKLFGFSVFSFRLVNWLGGLLLAAAAAALVRLLGGSRNWAAVCWVLVFLSPELGSTLSNGRMDTLAVAGELCGLVLLLYALQSSQVWRSWVWSLLAGLVWTGALLTTPRTLQFFLGLAIGAPWWLQAARPQWQKFMSRFAGAGFIVVAGFCIWLLTQGETPLSWFRYLSHISHYCRSSTIIGGFWQLRPSPFWLLTPLVCAILLGLWRVRGGAWRRVAGEHPALCWLVLALGGQGLLTFVTTVRPESYPLYWGLPCLIAVLAWLSVSHVNILTRRQWCVILLLVTCLFGGLRTLKLVEIAATWPVRNQQALENFTRQHIPPGARVTGPLSYYYYAVERSGSTYLFHEPLYDSFHPFLDNKLNPAYPEAMRRTYTAYFLLWPEGEPLPKSCRCSATDQVAHFSPPDNRVWFNRWYRFSSGYPATNLYRIPAPLKTLPAE